MLRAIYIGLQFLQAKKFFNKRHHNTQPNKGTTMIKDIIDETTASIESKLTGMIFGIAAGLTITAVLAYAVIKLIWYFESYLALNYGTEYAIFFVIGIVAVALAPLIYVKAHYAAIVARNQLKAAEKDIQPKHQSGLGDVLAVPEKIVQQAFMGFLDGLATRRAKSRSVLQDAYGNVETDDRDVMNRDFRPANHELNIERLRTTAAR